MNKISEKKKKRKPSFEEFMGRIGSIIEGPSGKKQINSIYGILKKGFEGRITDEHIESICARFFNWDQFSFLALKTALAVSCGPRQKDLVKKLSRKMREEAGRRSGFPFDKIPLFTNVSDPERKGVLEDWVSSNQCDPNDSLEWARYALTCLLNEELTNDDYELIRQIASSICKVKEPQKKSGSKFAKYILEICTPFADRKVKASRVQKLFDLTRIFEDRITEHRKQQRELEIELEDLNEEYNHYQEQLAITLEKLRLTEEEVESLKRELDLKSEQLRIETEKLGSSEKHWKHELERQLAGATYAINKKISHEVNEARLAINSERPDYEMALSRLTKIEEELRRVEARWQKG